MKCEIISIGSELTSGQNLDTNSQWLSRRLAEVGIAVGWHTTIADDFDANVEAFRIAAGRAGVVLLTGGLGPTQDDLTREALARAAGVELVFHQPSFDRISEMFAKRSRTMPERNRVQAMFPTTAEPIPNDHGTAPGVWMTIGKTPFAAMPGVPTEMHAMFQGGVLPRLLQMGLGGGVLVQRKINCFGAGESAVEQRLLDITRRGHVPEVGITVSDATISLRILAFAPDRASAEAQIVPIEKVIRERLGDLVFGTEDEELQDAVLALLAKGRKTLSVAESVTGGLIASRLTAVPGSSEWFRGGIVAYQNAIKVSALGVPSELIERKGVVSPEVAEAMAVACRVRFQTDLAISTTGIAGPESLGPDLPAGLVYTGLAWEGGSSSATWNWIGTRAEVQSRTTKMALNQARLHLCREA
jgi:nicotinamide-nucleotide amidase